jgi:hypothetical protein
MFADANNASALPDAINASALQQLKEVQSHTGEVDMHASKHKFVSVANASVQL